MMRRLKTAINKTFLVISATSLLALVMLVSLWIRSYWADEIVTCTVRAGYLFGVDIDRGQISIEENRYDYLAGSDELPRIEFKHISTTTPSFARHLFPSSFGYAAIWGDQKRHRDTLMAVIEGQLDGLHTDSAADPKVMKQIQQRIVELKHMPSLEWVAAAPVWPFALAAAILPALHGMTIVRRRRKSRAGMCVKCGYDLRATPNRCPECGTIPIKSAGIQRSSPGVESA